MWQLIAGPVLGVIGGGIEKFFELKTEQAKAIERDRERAHELAVMDKEAAIATSRLTIEASIRQDQAADQSFSESYRFANDQLIPEGSTLSRGQLGWIVAVEVISKSIRPLSTIWYQVAVAVVFGWAAWVLISSGGQIFTAEEAGKIFREVAYSIVGMAETTLFWWYGIRRMSKKKADA